MHNYDLKFEYRPGKWIFIPNKATSVYGKKLIKDLENIWVPDRIFCHLGKQGGHLAAIRPHQRNEYKASIDLRGFFPSTTRSKVVRGLHSIGYKNKDAFQIAERSCIAFQSAKHLPYGFVQSMHLATLALEASHLGKTLKAIRDSGHCLTMYVDDILISGSDFYTLQQDYERIVQAAAVSKYPLAEEKCSGPSAAISAFNIEQDHSEMRITECRFQKFVDDYITGNEAQREALLRYVAVVNVSQANALASI
ncbi:reverse transcriptase domain-containing protein [Roseinatronobacter sp.]|uniref:reverse transcriptase domain-containing protein n=1 Tax=Roseinatronobacter sp. TaxID=1945755 RepID=UPI0025ED6FCB|nr:reverse transcriptase domain-containing protein [Roseibaca sp.]